MCKKNWALFLLLISLTTSHALATPAGQWEFTGSLLYLEPSIAEQPYAIGVGEQPFHITQLQPQDIDYQYHFGFHFGIDYQFPCSLYHTQINWYHLKADDSDNFRGQVTIFDPVLSPIDVHADEDLQFDYGNLLLGRKIVLSPHFELDWLVGLAFLHLEKEKNTTFSFAGNEQNNPFMVNFHNNSRLKYGIGPEFGLNGQWVFAPCWSFVGGTSAALLYGDLTADANLTGSEGVPPAQITENTVHRVFPMVNGKLGIRWNLPIHIANTAGPSLEAGYQYHVALNALDEFNPQVLNPDAPPSQELRHTMTVGYGGPYLSFIWHV